MAHRPQHKRGKVHPFFIYFETNDFIIRNCMIDSEATQNIMPLCVMKTIGLDYTRHYKSSEFIFSIDSRSVPTNGEINYFYSKIMYCPHIHMVFTIIVVDLHSSYCLVLVRKWSYPFEGHLMNDGSCMMLPNKDGSFTRVPCEAKKHVCLKKKDHGMDNFLDMGLGNYVVGIHISNQRWIMEVIF